MRKYYVKSLGQITGIAMTTRRTIIATPGGDGMDPVVRSGAGAGLDRVKRGSS